MDTQEHGRTSADALLTRQEVADWLRVDPRTLRRWEQAGKLLNVSPGGRARYRAADIARLIDGNLERHARKDDPR